MRKATLMVVLTLACMLTSIASATTVNEVVIHCNAHPDLAQNADPLLHYGETPTAHNHTNFGSVAFGPNLTVPGMLESGSSCDVASDHTTWWVPTPMTGQGIPASFQTGASVYYLANAGYRLSPSLNIAGLRFVGGNSNCGSLTCDSTVFQCSYPHAPQSKTIPRSCTNPISHQPAGYSMQFYEMSQCWNGQSLGEGMGSTSAPNEPGVSIIKTTTGACPDGWTPVPAIVVGVKVGPDGPGGYLSSDAVLGTERTCPGCSAHVDFVDGQGQNEFGGSELSQIISECLDVTGWPNGPVQPCKDIEDANGAGGIYAATAPGSRVYRRLVTR